MNKGALTEMLKRKGQFMSQSLNKVILIGFLGDAPETRFTQQGKPVTKFSVAVNENWKDAQGTKQERVEWFRIVCFGRLAEVSGEYLQRGRHVYLEGRLQTRKWEDRQGEKRATVEVVASQMRILDRAPNNGDGSKAGEPPKAAESTDEHDNPFNEADNQNGTDEIPF
jgi:single-strand DNA-binding protein